MHPPLPQPHARRPPWPVVTIHGLPDALAALAPGRPVALLSGENAAGSMGAGWWEAIIAEARARYPETPAIAILDCGEAAGRALAALRLGASYLVLDQGAPGYDAVTKIAAAQKSILLHKRPRALDLGQPGAVRRLPAWLSAG